MAAPDDVLDALSPGRQSIRSPPTTAVAAGRTGLPWPDVNDAGAVSLLQTMRTAAGAGRHAAPAIDRRGATGSRRRPRPAGRHPVPARRTGRRARRSSSTGRPGHARSAWCPDFEYDDTDDDDAGLRPEPELCALSWTVYSLPRRPGAEHLDLGEAEYALRSAVRSAADALGALRPGCRRRRRRPARAGRAGAGVQRHHRAPDHAPTRALRVLENAAHVDAIITVSCRTDADRHSERHRRSRSPATRCARWPGGALGAAGRGQRDPAFGLASADRSRSDSPACTAAPSTLQP